MTEETTNEEIATNKVQPEITHTVIIEFKGPTSTELTAAYHYVSIQQIEIAAHFLLRQADKLYRQAEEVERARSLIPAPPGMKV